MLGVFSEFFASGIWANEFKKPDESKEVGRIALMMASLQVRNTYESKIFVASTLVLLVGLIVGGVQWPFVVLVGTIAAAGDRKKKRKKRRRASLAFFGWQRVRQSDRTSYKSKQVD